MQRKNLKLNVFLASVLVSTSALAQGLSPYGLWDNYKPARKPPNGYSLDLPDWNFEIIPAPRQNRWEGNTRPVILPVAPELIEVTTEEDPGTIIIDSEQRKLYLIVDEHSVYQYPISVGREGFAWTGIEKVSRIADWPDWTPPKEMLARRPDLPEFMPGGLQNPLGAKAIYLGNTLYRIHGTNDPKSIGRAESSGCIRMMNEHVVHLAQYVQIGTVVKVF